VSRVVVRVAGITPDDSEPEQIFVSLDDAPFAIPDAERLHPFACSADLMERFNAEPPAVRQVGETLLGRLGEHPAVADAMTMAMGIAPTDSRSRAAGRSRGSPPSSRASAMSARSPRRCASWP
jgi:hypothetical protein